MTRETKVGLLVGMATILLIGIILSDHLSMVAEQDPAFLPGYAEQVQRGISGEQAHFDPNRAAPTADLARRHMLPMPGEAIRPPSVPAQQGPTPAQIVPQPTVEGPSIAYAVDQDSKQRSPISDAAQPAPVAPTGHDGTTLQSTGGPGGQSPVLLVMGNPSVQDLTLRQAVLPTQAGGPTALSANSGNQVQSQPTIAPPPASDFYTVKTGDSLYAIAKRFYGDGEYWKMIVEANRDKVGRDGSVQEGIKLALPNKRGLIGHPDLVPVQTELDRPSTSDRATLPQMQEAALQRQVGQPLSNAKQNASGSGKIITVEAGQTLSQIAAKHLGSSKRWKELLAANGDQLSKPEELREGMELRLPATPEPTAAAPTSAPTKPTTPSTPALAASGGASSASGTSAGGTSRGTSGGGGGGMYTVKTGDTLSIIAQRTLGSRGAWKKIYDANRNVIGDPDTVEVGTTLTIPRG
jgi:nucleoid-associated protein YgaU